MIAEDSRIMNILYSPIMYIHSDKLYELHHSRDLLHDAILNHWIINQYQLENLPDRWQPDDAVSVLIFNHWQLIPKIASLIGGYLLREQLLMDKISIISDSTLLAFISLPLRHNVTINQQSNNIDYSSWGAAYIIGLINNLPSAFQQRLLLCFPPDMQLPNLCIKKTPDHINLLRMAINYAHDFQK